jgi:long-chain acyl-CoA synthetase
VYPGTHARERADQAAFIMASTGESVCYAEFEARANRLAHLLRAWGLGRLDHYAIFMENNDRYLEACAAGERAGLYYTCVNSYLTAPELAYILNNSTSKLLITSRACRDVALEAARECPRLTSGLIVDGTGDDGLFADFEEATRGFPDTPIADECMGTSMPYSSGTTGRPKGILRALDNIPPDEMPPGFSFLSWLWRYREGLTYLSPAPLYHSAPLASVGLAIRTGGTVIIMEKFDPEQYLSLVERYRVTHSQLVPTMFSRMLKLPARVRNRYDLSSLEVAIHAAAPCPVPVKQQMIDWWGPILLEYYASTEAIGFSACDSLEWLTHPGTVGKVVLGELHILDESCKPTPPGTPGTLWFKPGTPSFRYFNDVEKTAESTSPDGSMVTVGDVGYLDHDGYLYLTDRATFMIISGGVNIYPQESENLLITHPKVADAAVFGVPNEDLGEEVKAVVELMPGIDPGPDTAAELIAFCREHLAHLKCPRSVDFTDKLPRLPTGKLYKRALRDSYWGESGSRIV